MLDIYVDADACPVKQEVCRVALRYHLTVTFVSNSPMRIPNQEGVSLVVVEGQFDAADDWIVERVAQDDIVVTADIPLASRCIAKGAKVLGTTGRPFTEDNIGEAMATRELLSGLRDAGMVSGGPPPFQKKDRSRFLQTLDEIVQRVKKARGI
jgi:uncharacterized protein YaiI (UPF0178 family)